MRCQRGATLFSVLLFAPITRGKFWIGKVSDWREFFGLWLLVLAAKYDQQVWFPGCSMFAAPLKLPGWEEKFTLQGGFKATCSLWHGVETFVPLEWPARKHRLTCFSQESQVQRTRRFQTILFVWQFMYLKKVCTQRKRLRKTCWVPVSYRCFLKLGTSWSLWRECVTKELTTVKPSIQQGYPSRIMLTRLYSSTCFANMQNTISTQE